MKIHKYGYCAAPIVGSAMIISAPWTWAFQEPVSLAAKRVPKFSRNYGSKMMMAETSLPFGGSDYWMEAGMVSGRASITTPSFLAPLFNAEYDWPSRRKRRALFSSSMIVGSDGFSFLEESNLDDDEEDGGAKSLSYLPSGGVDLAPKSKALLQKVSEQYVTLEKPEIHPQEVLEVIEQEYQSYDVPVRVGQETFDVSETGKDVDSDIARILSFAALHRLPRDIAILLLGPSGSDGPGQIDYGACRAAFAKGGWKDVRFSRGLAVRLRRQYVTSKTEKYAPLPRAWVTTRRQASRVAEQAVTEAAYTSAPVRKLLSRDEFLAKMDEELSRGGTSKLQTNVFGDALISFPRKNEIVRRIKRTMARKSAAMKQAGRAGLVAYFGLSFAWYTFAIFWQWQRESSKVAISRAALGTALRRFGKVFLSAFISDKLTRLLRIQLALALAPLGDKALRLTQTKFRVSENRAFFILAGLMVLTCLGVWATIILGDAAMLKGWVIESYRHQAEILQLDAA
jgi:hypothetical protein